MKWTFNPPAAPHFGDVHEVMVKLAKRAIYGVLGDSKATDETSFSGVESLMNSRPLTDQTADTRDDTHLIPNYFLQGLMGGDFAPETEMMLCSPKKYWRKYWRESDISSLAKVDERIFADVACLTAVERNYRRSHYT